MLYFANPCADPVVAAAMNAGTLGYIDTLAQGNVRPAGVTWCADNGCFSDQWNENRWWSWLVANAGDAASCAFAVAPDVVGDAWLTHLKSAPWLPKIRNLGYPVAYVAQDGLEDLELPYDGTDWWDSFDVLFVGGTTAWKLGAAARRIVAEAKGRGKRVHMGRVNSERRYRYAQAIGCDSADGTFLTFGPTVNMPRLLSWLRLADHLPFDLGVIA